MGYWEDRFLMQQKNMADLALDDMMQLIRKAYYEAQYRTKGDALALYTFLYNNKGKNIIISDLYKYSKYYEITNEINKHLVALGGTEVKIFDGALLKMYQDVQKELDKAPTPISMSLVSDERAREVVNSIWCADGKSWSSRIWTNTDRLKEKLTNGVIDSITRGTGVKGVSDMLQREFSVSYNQAKRLADTELSRVSVQSQLDRYAASGFDTVVWTITPGINTCEDCESMDGQEFPILTAPTIPLHPQCHCLYLPKEGNL